MTINRNVLLYGVIQMKSKIFLFAGLLLATSQMFAGVTKVGTTAAGFLMIDVGSRANGMGSAFVSIADDATAMYWNPAGIAGIDGFEATFCNSKWIGDLGFTYTGAVQSLGQLGNIGINATFLTMEEIERTTIAYPDGSGEYFDAGCYAVGLSYARKLTDNFSIGFNTKLINERMYHSSASGFALDIGALFDTQLSGLKLGMCISNYGTKMHLDGRDLQVQHDISESISGNNDLINARLQTDYFDLPLLFRFGVSMDVLKGFMNSNLILSADALHPSDDTEYINLGAEYKLFNLLSLRVGLKQLFAKDSEQGLTFGGGIHYKLRGTTTFYFDYSYSDFGLLNSVNIFSVGLAF